MQIKGGWIGEGPVRRVFDVLADAGHQAFAVGGCVRNDLLGLAPADIDFATDALPDQVINLAQAADIRAVPTGVDHGTVTLVVNGQPFEVTTFRKDVETNGRHAVVAFSKDMADDAARRDFTMNALYAGPDGAVVDPVDGLPDLTARRVRFVGQAEDRVREDILRILRFFRFHAWYGDPSEGLDTAGLDACARHADKIKTLSRERVGAEMLKLLAAPDPAPSIAAMAQTGVLTATLAGADGKALTILTHIEAELELSPDPLRRLASLGGKDVSETLRLSRKDAARVAVLRDGAIDGVGPAELGYRLGARDGLDALALRAALTEQRPTERDLAFAAQGAAAVFPIQAADLMPDLEGAALGAALKEREARWIASGFTLDRKALLG